jgi:uncharacterized protein YwgA
MMLKCGELIGYQAELVRYVLKRGPIAHIKLVKLLFIIDRELYRRFSVAAFHWKMYNGGPLSCEVLDVVEDLERGGFVISKWADGAVVYELTSTVPSKLPQGVREVVDQILETWIHRGLDDVAEYIKSLDEVRGTPPGKRLLCDQ